MRITTPVFVVDCVQDTALVLVGTGYIQKLNIFIYKSLEFYFPEILKGYGPQPSLLDWQYQISPRNVSWECTGKNLQLFHYFIKITKKKATMFPPIQSHNALYSDILDISF